MLRCFLTIQILKGSINRWREEPDRSSPQPLPASASTHASSSSSIVTRQTRLSLLKRMKLRIKLRRAFFRGSAFRSAPRPPPVRLPSRANPSWSVARLPPHASLRSARHLRTHPAVARLPPRPSAPPAASAPIPSSPSASRHRSPPPALTLNHRSYPPPLPSHRPRRRPPRRPIPRGPARPRPWPRPAALRPQARLPPPAQLPRGIMIICPPPPNF
jgi:hypothetical protein